jgi:hypothetical protein
MPFVIATVAGYTAPWQSYVRGTVGRKAQVFNNLDLLGVWMNKA